ncbi:hypothetical protein AAG747_16120 [Rapidithrix thailandica]|uniref:Uncharacterized protein n=1 Tax=Rapidithrix thailandica TaxID=413964 RepID=A0AAW9SAD4_9BACT
MEAIAFPKKFLWANQWVSTNIPDEKFLQWFNQIAFVNPIQ